MKERDIERHLVKRVKALGGEVRKVQWIGRRGAPDRLVLIPAAPRPWHNLDCRKDHAIWVEVKAPGVKAEPHQLREHERMRAMGQRVVVIDSIEGVEELLASSGATASTACRRAPTLGSCTPACGATLCAGSPPWSSG